MAGSSTRRCTVGLLLLLVVAVTAAGEDSLQATCAEQFTKVAPCMDYATAKASSPSASCCSAVTEIRDKAPVCLCYIIQQTHNGSPTIKSLGVQFERLVQLSDACKLANSSLSDCPKLLGLSPSSPDYALFTNATKATPASTAGLSANATSSTPTSSSTPTASTSGGIMHHVHVGLTCTFVAALLSAVFINNIF